MGRGTSGAFVGGLQQGLGLYNDIRRTNLYEDEIKDRRERQRNMDALEKRKTDAYLDDMARRAEIADASEARAVELHEQSMVQKRAGDLADHIRTITTIPDQTKRQEALDNLALSINQDPYLAKYLNLNPETGTGQGRNIVGFQILNPDEKDPAKYMFTPIVHNEALNSVGPYTTDPNARFGQQKGLVFSIDALDKIAGRKKDLITAVPKGGDHPVYMPRDNAEGLMPEGVWNQNQATERTRISQAGATTRAGLRASKGKDPWTEYQGRASKFFSTHQQIKTGNYYSMDQALEAQDVAGKNGIFLVFNQATDPVTGNKGVRLVDHRPLDQSVEVASPQGNQQPGQGQGAGQTLNPGMETDKPSASGDYYDPETGQTKKWDADLGKYVKVKVNGQWQDITTEPAQVTPAAAPTKKEGPPTVRGGLLDSLQSYSDQAKEKRDQAKQDKIDRDAFSLRGTPEAKAKAEAKNKKKEILTRDYKKALDLVKKTKKALDDYSAERKGNYGLAPQIAATTRRP